MKYKLPYTVAELLQLRAEGKTNFQIARHFRISTSRVIGIIATEKRNALAAQRSAGLRQEIAAGDTLIRGHSPIFGRPRAGEEGWPTP